MRAQLIPRTRIGHAHLKVAALERAIAFYRNVLGFELSQRYGRAGSFLAVRRCQKMTRLPVLGSAESA